MYGSCQAACCDTKIEDRESNKDFLSLIIEQDNLGMDCSTVCAGKDSGLAGDCCGTQYCDCGDNTTTSCGEGKVWCTALGLCNTMYGQDCRESGFCCSVPTTTTQATTTTDSTIDCSTFCAATDKEAVGECCSSEYCDCRDGSHRSCGEGEVWCEELGICNNLYGQDCYGSGFCCSATIDCPALCADKDSGTAGECCGSHYCDCGDLSVTTCYRDTVYCSALDMCTTIYDGTCQDSGFCCSDSGEEETEVEAGTLEVEAELDCEATCRGEEVESYTGGCCSQHYCYCGQDSVAMQCAPGARYCPAAGQCAEMTAMECSSLPSCCRQ